MEDHIQELAQQLSAQAWCTDETRKIEMDTRLATAFTNILGQWLETAAMFQRNSDYYRGLVDAIAAHCGADAYIADDGSVSDEPIRAKIPELVGRLVGVKS